MSYKSIGFSGLPGGSSFLTGGKVFFVDGTNGDNENTGLNPDQAFDTITYALTQCLDGRNDYILVLAASAAETYPLVLDITYLHLIGVGGIGGASPAIELDGAGNNVFTLNTTSRYTELANFTIYSAAANGMNIANTAYGMWIHHNQFGGSGIGALVDGISGTGLGWCLLEENRFGSSDPAFSLTGFGMQSANFVMCTIRRNSFLSCALNAIDIACVEVGPIYENYFFSAIASGLADGWAITLDGGAGVPGGPITNNWAAQTGDNTGNNPYRDTSTGAIATTLCGWGMNYSGQAVVAPATA